MKRITIEVTEEYHRQLKMFSALESKSIKELVLIAIEKTFGLKEEENNKNKGN